MAARRSSAEYADRLAWWVSEKDRSQTEAINKGFTHATGSIHAWLNSDDTYTPHAIAEAVEFLADSSRGRVWSMEMQTILMNKGG